jgi:hypothetical protein
MGTTVVRSVMALLAILLRAASMVLGVCGEASWSRKAGNFGSHRPSRNAEVLATLEKFGDLGVGPVRAGRDGHRVSHWDRFRDACHPDCASTRASAAARSTRTQVTAIHGLQ